MPNADTTILIVDDDPLHLTLYSWILQRQGYKCKTAQVKSTTVELPSDAAIDLVLLDYRLSSSLTPLEVIEQLKKAYASAPVVVLSEMQWMPDDMRGHATAFINKGDPARLIETVASVLNKPS